MSLTILGWFLIASSLVISTLAIVPLATRDGRSTPFDLEAWLRSTGFRFEQALRGTARTLIVTGAVFLFVAGVGAATSFVETPQDEALADDTDDALLARLDDYARSTGSGSPATTSAADSKALPDVDTMIAQLAARLESAPEDVKGWRMLGWSYFNTGHYEEAASAYAKAAKLDPGSAEIKRAYDEAKAKASGDGNTKN